MKGKPKDGDVQQEEAAAEERGQEEVEVDYSAQIAERDSRIAELEGQLAESAKIGEENASLKAEVEQLKNSAASARIDFALQLAGCKSVKAARAVLDDYDGDVEALKAAEGWMFNVEAPAEVKPKGATGLPNAGAADDDAKLLKRMRRAAGLPSKKSDE